MSFWVVLMVKGSRKERSRNPGLEDTIPLGLVRRHSGIVGNDKQVREGPKIPDPISFQITLYVIYGKLVSPLKKVTL